MSTISKQLKRLREEAELSQHQLAATSGVSVGFISKLEADKYRTVSLDKCQQLAKGLGITLKDFLAALGFLDESKAPSVKMELQYALRGSGYTPTQAKQVIEYAQFIKDQQT